MRLQQFLSSVFPRLSRTKSERNRQSNAADEKVAEQKNNSDSQLELSDLKYAFDAVDPAAHGQGSSGVREGTAKKDCGHPESVRGGVGGVTEGEMHWISEQFEDNNRTGAAVSRSRSMIRTNPWLASPKSQHNESMQSEETAGPLSLHKSLPTTPTTSLVVGLKGTMDYRQALHARRELGLLLKVPGNLDDSSSEGYASSVFRSPSGTDLDSIEGCPDSALASSISSESDFDWGASLVPSHSPLCHAARTTSGHGKVGIDRRATAVGKNEEVLGVAQFKTDDHSKKTTNSGKEELYSKKLQHTEGVSVRNDKEELVVESKASIGIKVPPEHPRELKLVKCYNNSEHSSPKPVLQCSSHNQCESPNRLESIEQTDASRPLLSTQTNQNNATAVEEDSDESKDDEEKTEVQNMNGGAIERSGSTRSLSEISESLQDKVRRLHEQKLYVDAIFHRAREEDQQRESQFAKFRSQFVAAKRQALLRKLQELQTMLGKQSTKLQVVYDAVLLVQWPKVFKVGEVKSN